MSRNNCPAEYGYIYFLPNAGGNGYVGQTVQPGNNRFYQHVAAGKDISGKMALSECFRRGPDLDAAESWHMGYMGTMEACGGVNIQGPKDKQMYALGAQCRAEALASMPKGKGKGKM